MSPTPRARQAAALVAGRYRLGRKLGSGYSGSVYLAEDVTALRVVALKLLRRDRLGDDGGEQLKREFRAFAALRHPHIARAYDFGYTAEGLPFYTREYVDGEPLPPGPSPSACDGAEADAPLACVQPILDLLDALDYLHARELLHLDVHAGNVILASDRRRGAVLIDFGLRPPDRLAGTSFAAAGTAPLENDEPGPPSRATDLSAVSRLLLYRVTGHARNVARLPREIPGWGPRRTLALERVLSKALHREPAERFTSALEFANALATAAGRSGISGKTSGASFGATFRADARRESSRSGMTTLGRDAELARIDETLERAAAGGAAGLCLVGPPGIGKSRLLTEARWRAQLRGLTVLELSFSRRDAAAPSLERLLRRLRGAESSEREWLRPLHRRHGGSSRARAARAAEAYFARAGGALVLLLDDLDDADRESALLAEALLAECGRRHTTTVVRGLAVLATRRARVPGAAGVILERLRPLKATDARKLLGEVLRPASLPPRALVRLAASAHGNPGRLQRTASALADRYGATGRLPEDAEIAEGAVAATETISLARVAGADPRAVVTALGVSRRPLTREEMSVATGLSARRVGAALRRLRARELVVASPSRSPRLYDLAGLASFGERDADRDLARTIHARLVTHLDGITARDLREQEALARHLIALGRRREARDEVLLAARRLAAGGEPARAIRLLELAGANETSRTWRLRFAEEISDLHVQAGDHNDGIETLEPLFREAEATWRGATAVRLRRRLGVHYHRAGRAGEAVELFEAARARARLPRDRHELVFILSELAEIHTLRGEFERAESACREGLALLAHERGDSSSFRGAMEVTLRGSLGHLHLRRLELEAAREELGTADRVARRQGSHGDHALILNNLGIVLNQLNRFDEAERCFRRSERLLASAGERGPMIHTACNLAVIAAKRGDEETARADLQRARLLARDHAGDRPRFHTSMTRALTEHLLGDMQPAIGAFQEALPLGRRLGDEHLVRFGEVYLAEALATAGEPHAAWRALERTLRDAARHGPDVLARMAATRLLLLSRLYGRRRQTRRFERELETRPRGHIELLEAWNDLVAAAACEDASDAAALLDDAGRTFERVGVAAGRRLARAHRLALLVRADRTNAARSVIREIEEDARSSHRVVAVLEPLACAEAWCALGNDDAGSRALERARSALVGLPFLELDLRLEVLSARLAAREGDREGARHHVHRAVQVRDLLARSVPPRWRAPLLAEPRFRALDELRESLDDAASERSTPPRPRRGFAGIVGDSPAMQPLFASLRKLRSIELPVVIAGETGSGKELVARAIHETGRRSRGPFLSLHCGSLPHELFESELFGHAAGAFTGADETRPGLLEHAGGGVVLLDEITQLAPATQTKLLRVVDDRVVRRVGDIETRPIDVQFITTVSEEPAAALASGRLRADLYHRLRGVEIRVPPLRERLEDLPVLCRHFLARHAQRLERRPPSIGEDAMALLRAHPWPGNVRELETLLLRLVLDARSGDPLGAEQIASHLASSPARGWFPSPLLDEHELAELRGKLEEEYLSRLFLRERGDIRRIAAKLGVKRSNLYSWFKRVGIDPKALRARLRR